jgi:putative sigma-54 modulation protein
LLHIGQEESMSTAIPDNRAPFAEQTLSLDKQHEGRTEASETHLEIRNLDGGVDDALHAWVHERLGRQLGKYGTLIERIDVRFGDENGPKGGIDRCCMVHVILSSLPPVVIEMRAGEDREAFDLAAGRAERAIKRSVQKHGFSSKHKGRQRGQHGAPDVQHVQAALEEAGLMDDGSAPGQTAEPLYGKRVGHGHDDLLQVQQRSEKRDVDTARPGVSADMRKAGDGHTATRNTKLNTAGFVYELEDSTDGKPSRKSTRAGKNRVKHGQALALRSKDAVHSPPQRAQRAQRG